MLTLSQIIKLKYPSANMVTDVKIWDEGNGAYIKEWNVADEPQPTDNQIQQWLNDEASTIEWTLQQYTPVLNNWIDTKARERGYNDSVSALTYLSSNNTEWAAEAARFRDWRDSVWEQAITLQNNLMVGTAQLPESFEAFLSTLPELNWGD